MNTVSMEAESQGGDGTNQKKIWFLYTSLMTGGAGGILYEHQCLFGFICENIMKAVDRWAILSVIQWIRKNPLYGNMMQFQTN